MSGFRANAHPVREKSEKRRVVVTLWVSGTKRQCEELADRIGEAVGPVVDDEAERYCHEQGGRFNAWWEVTGERWVPTNDGAQS